MAPARTAALIVAALSATLVVAAPAAATPRTISWASPPGPGGPFAETMGVEFPSSNGVSEVCGVRRERINPNLQAITTAVTPDGARVFFTTVDPMVAEDTDAAKRDIYEFSGGQTTLISTGIPVGDHAYMYGCSTDGSRVFFGSTALIFSELYEHTGGVTSQVNVSETLEDDNATIGSIAISADGTKVMFDTFESLTSDDTDNGAGSDVFQRSGGNTELVSTPGTGGGSNLSAVSADGSRIWFDSNEQHEPARDTNPTSDVYLSTNLATPTVVSVDADTDLAAGGTFQGATPDGGHVFFTTAAGIDATDIDAASDLYDRHGAATTWISKPDPGATNDGFPQYMAASPDGSRIYFSSDGALKTTDADGTYDLYLRDGSALTLISRQVAGGGQNVQTGCNEVSVIRGCASTDGSRIFFTTQERLTAGDTDVNGDLYRYTAPTGPLELVSGQGDHEYNIQGMGVSENGARVIFDTGDPLLPSIDTKPDDSDVYEWEDGALTMVSTPVGAGEEGNVLSGTSADAATVFFASNAPFAGSGGDNLMDLFAARPIATAPKQCADGADNDDDGVVDKRDPGCLSGTNGAYNATDDNESDESLRDLILCGRRQVGLVRASLRGRKVVMSGVVSARVAGKSVSILANYKPAGRSAFKKLATVKPNAAGQFTARVKRPPARLLGKARLQARVGTFRSVKLKLSLSLAASSLKLRGGKLVLKGKAKRALVGKRNPVVVKRALCGRYQTVGNVKPKRSGAYTVRIPAPAAAAALYRVEAKLLRKPGGKRYRKQFAHPIGITLPSR